MECFIILDTKHFFFFSFRAYWEEQKLIQHHIIAGSDEVRGWGSYSLWWLSDRLRGSALILTMLADVKALRLGAVRCHAFTPVVQYLLIFLKMKHSCVNYPYPIMHPAMTRFPMIWMSVFSGKTHCSYFIDIACLKPKMLTTCLFQIPAFTFQCEVLCPKMYCSVKPLFLFHFMESGIWFQMIAPAHAYALYKHEKPR